MPDYCICKQGFLFGRGNDPDSQKGFGDVVTLTEEEAAIYVDNGEMVPADDWQPEMTVAAPTGEPFATADLPHGDKLTAAGYETAADVITASDSDLLKVDGIGKASLRDIREFLGDG